jgi:hypothetical protein
MSNPWNGKAVLEVFWWNCWNASFMVDMEGRHVVQAKLSRAAAAAARIYIKVDYQGPATSALF